MTASIRKNRRIREPFIGWVLMGVFVFGMAIIFPASAQDWQYSVRPGDTLWELCQKHLRSPAQWTQMQEYNQVDDPWNMRPGTRLNFPIDWLRISPAPVQLVAATGEVSMQRSENAPESTADAGQQFGAGMVLITGQEGNATLRFADGSRMQVLSDSRIIFDTLSAFGETGMVDTRMRLQYGRVDSRVQRARGPASRFIIATPPAISSVRGTELRVALDEHARRMITEVPKGEVAVTSERQSYRLSAGQGVFVESSRDGSQPQPLLPPPKIDTLDTGPWRGGEIVEWQPVPETTDYRLQLVETESELVQADIITSATQAPLPSVDNGRYTLRVRAIAADGLEGLDATHTLDIHAKPEPPFVLEPGAQDRLNPGRVRFRWTRSETAAGYRLQLAEDENFSSILVDRDTGRRTSLRPRQSLNEGVYFWRIAARDAEGNEGPFGGIQRLEIREGPDSPEMRKARRSKARWQAGEPGHRYHVQIARNADFEELVMETTVDQPEISIADLSKGRFYIRIRTVDDDGYKGSFGPAQEISNTCWVCRGGIAAAIVLGLILL